MNIIEVIPIARGMGAETLSYFCPEPLPEGALVSVPLRKKTVSAVVASSRPAGEMKSDLKRAAFSLKKITSAAAKNAVPFFSKEFISMTRQVADYYAASMGSVLATLVPETLLSRVSSIRTDHITAAPDVPRRKKIFEIHAVQGDDEERYGSYRGLIRQEFAQKSSVLILLPSAEDAERAYDLLEKGIEGYAYLIHTSLPKKRLLETWNAVIEEPHPVVIIATGSFLSVPRPDIGIIVLEKENSRGWKQPRRPFVDMRRAAELYAKEHGIPIVLGDTFLTVETLWRESEGEVIAGAPFKFRSLGTARDTLIDMRKKPDETDEVPRTTGQFKIISETAEELIRANKRDSEHIIVFALRRGHAPSVVCADCQSIVTCNECSKPVVLHRAPANLNRGANASRQEEPKSFFLCHRCGARRSSEETCKTCGSWKLATVGIGIDLVAEKIRDKFPDIKLFQIDADSTPNEKLARAVVAAFRASPGSILLGTEMMLSYLHEKVDNAIVVSLDSLFSIPDFRIHEKILHLLLSIRSVTLREFIVQTRKADEKIFEYALKSNLNEFFRTALNERKTFSYPPFATLIKLTLEGKKDAIVAEMAEIKKLLEAVSASNTAAPYAVDIFPAFTHTVRGNFVLHGLVRIPRGRYTGKTGDANWPDEKLSAALRALPPSVTVNVDPDTLL
jgi:primosomal protein N' (replication factor Y)